jgi:hypothetical protein
MHELLLILFDKNNLIKFSFSNPQMGGNTIDELLSRVDSDTILQHQDSINQK